MKLVIFGLTITSSRGNGHATLWHALCKALAQRGHDVVFFERDVSYYALNRDLLELPHGELCLYAAWQDALPLARWYLSDADAAMVTCYCPDGIAASDPILKAAVPVRTFYDLDTPVTLARLKAGETVDYIGPRGLSEFDVVLSYTGARARGAAAAPWRPWIWGAFKMPGAVLHDLQALWCDRQQQGEYMGTLINAYIAGGREALRLLTMGQAELEPGPEVATTVGAAD